VQFEIDANGILHVLARDLKSGAEKVVEIQSAVDVDDAAVQQMVEESVEHAFDDLASRRWIEMKMKAVELVRVTRQGVADCADELEAAYRQQVESAVAEVERALGTEEVQANSGDTRRLQAACAALDEITKPLAELLMDKAMEAVLRRRGVLGGK
jgi:molecular chaperone DnaK